MSRTGHRPRTGRGGAPRAVPERRGPFERRLLDAVPGARWWTATVAGLEGLRGAAIAAQAVTLAAAVAALAGPQPVPGTVGRHLAVFVAATVLRAAVSIAAGRLAAGGAGRTVRVLRRRGAAFLLAGTPGAPGTQCPAGEAPPAVVLGPGLDAVEDYVRQVVPTTLAAAVITPVVLLTIGWIDPMSLAIVAVPLALVPVFMILIGRRTEERVARRWEALAGLSARFLDAVEGLATLRAFDRTAHERRAMAEAGERLRRATMGVLAVSFLSAFALELLATIGTALVAVPLGIRLVDGRITLAPALAVLVLTPEVFLPLRRAAASFHGSTEGLAALDAYAARFGSLRPQAGPTDSGTTAPEEKPEEKAPAPVRHPPASVGSPPAVSVRHLRVTSGGVTMVTGVDLDVAPGERVALVGPSGAGKTTLLRAVAGLVLPSSGTVRIAGSIDPGGPDGAWRSAVGWVGQDPIVVAGTIRDNLVLGTDPASGVHRDDSALWDALDRADLAPLVARLPGGLDAPVGEGGTGLSAGERQRLAVARVILRRDAWLVVLDEPTSHLDPASERRVVDRLATVLAGRTVLLATHRVAPLDLATRIVHVAGGALETGPLALAASPVLAASPALAGATAVPHGSPPPPPHEREGA